MVEAYISTVWRRESLVYLDTAKRWIREQVFLLRNNRSWELSGVCVHQWLNHSRVQLTVLSTSIISQGHDTQDRNSTSACTFTITWNTCTVTTHNSKKKKKRRKREIPAVVLKCGCLTPPWRIFEKTLSEMCISLKVFYGTSLSNHTSLVKFSQRYDQVFPEMSQTVDALS